MNRVRLPAICLSALLLAACGGSSEVEDPPNQAPQLALANPDSLLTLGDPAELDPLQGGLTFSDPDGDALVISFAFDPSLPPGVLQNNGRLVGIPNQGGRYTVILTATDPEGLAVSDRFDLLVIPGRDPRLTTPVLPATLANYRDALPAHLTAPVVANTDNTPVDNPITDAGATLGRVLFYDTRLSATNNVACASCHQQAFGFSDPEVLSEGFAGGRTGRHSMGLTNARFYARGRAFWDERAATLEVQALQPIQDLTEMGMTLPALEIKLAATPFYPPLFQAAFGTPEVTSDRIARAIAQFVRSMVSYRSKFDLVQQGLATFTAEEQRGQQIYTTPPGAPGGLAFNCAVCHGTPAHVAPNIFNNGLDAVLTDTGAGGGRFKSPSLRNIAVRAPYMHDGRFATLEQVVDFYSTGVQFSPTLSGPLVAAPGVAARLDLSDADKAALLAFLRTFTDEALIADSRFSDPFPLDGG